MKYSRIQRRAIPYAVAVAALLSGLASTPCSPVRSVGAVTRPTTHSAAMASRRSGLRLAFDWDRVKKTQGPPDELDSITERRETLLVAYGVNDRLGLFARIPYSERSLTETVDGEAEELGLRTRRPRALRTGSPVVVAVPWRPRTTVERVPDRRRQDRLGQQRRRRGGERLDEHVQPGTGSVDEFLGVAGSYQISHESAVFASAQYRNTGRNDAGYKYGNTALLNVAYDRRLSDRWDVVLEADYRDAQHDEIDSSGAKDPNTGGSITY